MKRKSFIINSSVLSAGSILLGKPIFAQSKGSSTNAIELFNLFQNPQTIHRPFVRWWWNGNKLERREIVRELKLLKQAGIGGVEINPIKFPPRTDNLGIPTLKWLSPEWIEMLDFTLTEAKKEGIICDLM